MKRRNPPLEDIDVLNKAGNVDERYGQKGDTIRTLKIINFFL